MRLAFVARAIFDSSTKALIRLSVAIALFGTIIVAGAGAARAAPLPDPCPTGNLGNGTGQDIVINRECHVGSGKYLYGKVNIIQDGAHKGKLVFDELIPDVKIDFWASSILVENESSLIAGTPAQPFGSQRGKLTIHLYGKDQGVGGVGIKCVTPAMDGSSAGQCGIPNKFWNDGWLKPVKIPGYPDDDYFYKYKPLPFDNGNGNAVISDSGATSANCGSSNSAGCFGYKVLAVSYGGTLQLFGNKGADYTIVDTGAGAKDSGKSWVRLAGTILPDDAAKTLTVASPSAPGRLVDWQVGDHIVVTTTDYFPSHSEELVICSVDGNKIGYTSDTTAIPVVGMPATCPVKGVQWTHNGEQFPFPTSATGWSRLNITKTSAETRAAVGLLTRSIRIVSEGNTPNAPLPAPADPSTDRYFGGHSIVRQGFKVFQVQGVEFRQMGQGGRLGHYPIHFHMVRKAAPATFVKDSSINESMTRWITVHATQNVTLARNVGYLSIGHGYYLEDAVETDNKFYSNLGIFARAAVKNDQNPRTVPGILASGDENHDLKYDGDKDTPAVFWITNGWNDFQGNMAAGAGMCGVCYWQVPASISGGSQRETWASYASEQTDTRIGSSPLMNFDGNYCTSAMMSFQTVSDGQHCPGVVPAGSMDPNVVSVVKNIYAPDSNAFPSDCGPKGSNPNWPICPDDYYPAVFKGQLNHATQCPATGVCDDNNPNAILCQNANEKNCLPTVINNYTTSFNWAEYNIAAIWLRRRWHLVSNSFISDVQNAGLSFISGGDYTNSSAIKGLWELALKTVFAGQTQPADKNHGFASVLTPFTPETAGLKCDNDPKTQDYCLSKNNSFTLGGFTGFSVSQHMFNIYDGPANEDSNAYLDIKRVALQPSNSYTDSVYKNVSGGIPRAVKADTSKNPVIPVGACYMQNAAIAWKQSNGFYYPPTFHSTNLFFNNVDIRHYVIVPQFIPDTYKTDPKAVAERYCTPPKDTTTLFNNYSGVDRQTELTDDDGSLTGYQKTISVNEDPFFKAPKAGIECDSDGAVKEGGTATTSPYDYVTTVVYPDSAKKPNKNTDLCLEESWGPDCTNQNCFGVPLYREYQTGTETQNKAVPNFIRMAGMKLCQRETMSVNHGHYLIDTTASATTQSGWGTQNVFKGGKTYDFFHVYATPKTEQTFYMYVGPGFVPAKNVKLIRVDVENAPFTINPGSGGDGNTLKVAYDGNILTVTLNHSAFASEYASAVKSACVPEAFCLWNGSTCVGKTGVFTNLTQEERDKTCGHAGKDVDCPTGGCIGFSVTLPLPNFKSCDEIPSRPQGFMACDQTTKTNLPMKYATCFPKDINTWDIPVISADSDHVGTCTKAHAPLTPDFCP